MVNYGKHSIDKSDINAVIDVLNSDWLTQGPKIDEFEEALAEYCGAKYAVAVVNGTAALHLANLVIGTNSITNVVTTPITFLATPNSILYAGGRPFFADISEETFTIDPSQVKQLVEEESGFKGIIPVHMGGVICDMESLKKIADSNNLWIIEDACHALGGKWIDNSGNSHRVGDCSHSDMTIFSFHPVKQITTGEGGAITTNNPDLYKKLLSLRTHGMIKDPELLIENHGDWFYEMHNLGYNYRMTDIQAALGIEQLKKNDNWVKMRRELVHRYDDAFKGTLNLTPQEHRDIDDSFSYHLYIIQCKRRAELYTFLRDNGVNTQVHYIPIHLQPFYKEKYGYVYGDFPVAELFYEKALSLPLYPTLGKGEQDFVINLIREFYGEV